MIDSIDFELINDIGMHKTMQREVYIISRTSLIEGSIPAGEKRTCSTENRNIPCADCPRNPYKVDIDHKA